MDKSHGRLEIRRIWISDELEDACVDFPGSRQIFRIERIRTVRPEGKTTSEIVHGVTSLSPEQASAATVLSFNREHWGIENKVHWVRDVTFDEDRSQVRRGEAPQTMATLRNLVVGLLRLCGVENIAAGLRHLSWNQEKVLALVGV